MVQENKVYKVLDVARYIINYSNRNDKSITHLKLQKLIYYVQANFLVNRNGVHCFEENILNWDYGPVINEVYYEFRGNGKDYLPNQEEYTIIEYDEDIESIKFCEKRFDEKIIMDSDKEMINEVIDSYFQYTAFEMVNKTHGEDPWKSIERNKVIDKEIIREYYLQNSGKIKGES